MTVARRHGWDSPFGAWIRAREDLDSVREGITVNDVDWVVHRYKNNVDGMGARTVHLMVEIEVKFHGDMPSENQRQTLFFRHQFLNQRRQLVDARDGSRKAVWHFGHYVLSHPGSEVGADDSLVHWCTFDNAGSLVPHQITVADSADIIRFDIAPNTLKRLDLRRHHKTRFIASWERTPLGFLAPRIIKKAS